MPVGSAIDELPDPASDEAFWEVEYRREVAGRAIQVMRRDFDAATWQAFWACVVEGRSAPDVGRSLGLSAGAVPPPSSACSTGCGANWTG